LFNSSLSNIVNAATNPASALVELVTHCDFLPVATESLLLCAARPDSYASAWFRVFKMTIHIARCQDATCRVRATPDEISTLRKHFTPLFIPTLNDFDSLISKTAFSEGLNLPGVTSKKKQKQKTEDEITKESAALWQSVLSWRALGTALGLHEEAERGDRDKTGYHENRFCWWAKCDTKSLEAEETYKRCSGCHAVTYCSADHQKKDWKEGSHRDICSILQNA